MCLWWCFTRPSAFLFPFWLELWKKTTTWSILAPRFNRQCHFWFDKSETRTKRTLIVWKRMQFTLCQFIFGTLLHWAIFQYWSFLQNYLSNIYNPQAGGGGWWEGRWESREGGERNQEELIRRWRDGKWRRRSKQKRNKINNKAIHVQHLHNLSREAITFGYSISHM